MDDGEYAAVWMIALSFWPDSKAPNSPQVRKAWRHSLDRFPMEVVARSLEELSETRDRFPSKAILVAACKETRQRLAAEDEKRLRLTAPPMRSWHEQPIHERVAEFDRAGAEMREERRREVMLYAYGDPHSVPPRPPYRPWLSQGITEQEWLRRTEAEISRVGPFEARARKLMTGEVAPEQGLAEFFAGFNLRPGPQRLGDILLDRRAVREDELPGILARLGGQTATIETEEGEEP